MNAKLLTGGLVPLCTTVASQAIFDAFSSADKSDALLHGHSYTAHAVGCQVGVEALRRMDAMARGGQWADHRRLWQEQPTAAAAAASTSGPSDIWSVWSPDVIRRLSQTESVEGVWALGTVLVMSLRDVQGGGKFPSSHHDPFPPPPSPLSPIPRIPRRLTILTGLGYTSTAAQGLQQQLARQQVHSRVLGNVVYVMASLTTGREIERIERVFLSSLV